jgi:rubrerythrin
VSFELDAADLFSMARQIEADACEFYRRAAMITSDRKCQAVLMGLAEMEVEHRDTFAGLEARCAEIPVRPDPPRGTPGTPIRDWPLVTSLLASGVKEDLAARFTGRESSTDILHKAIDFERDSIVFFSSIRATLNDSVDRQCIDEIIREELGHILTLNGELARTG